MTSTAEQSGSKVPAVTLVFWIIKIAATTLGETAGDTITMTLGWGYLAGTAVFLTLLVVLIAIQIAASKFHPLLYWATIIASTTAGTTLADFADRSLGIGYAGGSALLLAGLIAVLGLWYWSLGSISVATVSTPKVEAFYWTAITLSQTLGTALGDWTADDTGLGYEGGALVFAAALAALALAYYLTNVSRVFLFWAAFILSRPLGATVGDFLDKPVSDGGLALSRPLASAVIGAFIVACLLLLPQRAARTRQDPHDRAALLCRCAWTGRDFGMPTAQIGKLLRHRQLRYFHEIDGHERRDVGDGKLLSGDIRPLFQFAIEEAQKFEHARLVGFAPRRHLRIDHHLHGRMQMLKQVRHGKVQMELDAPAPHFDQRAVQRAAAEQWRLGLQRLEIAADSHQFRDHRAIVEH